MSDLSDFKRLVHEPQVKKLEEALGEARKPIWILVVTQCEDCGRDIDIYQFNHEPTSEEINKLSYMSCHKHKLEKIER